MQRQNRHIARLVAGTAAIVAALSLFALQAPVVSAAAPSGTVIQLADAAPPTNAAAKGTQLSNPLGTSDIPTLLGRVVRIITGISGSLALLMFVYGGFVWVTSSGSPEKVKKGKQIFVTSVLGLFIIFGAYMLVSVVIKALSGAGYSL